MLVAVLASGCTLVEPSSTVRPSATIAAPSPSASAAPTPPATATPVPTVTASPASIRLDKVADGFDQPLDVAVPEDGTGRIFVVEQGGRIRIMRDGTVDQTPFLDISDRISAGGERGLLGMALHPDYPSDGRIFVDYTDKDGNTVVSSFATSLDADVIDPGTEKVLLQVQQPYPNHNGGSVVFGGDGMLYIGDGRRRVRRRPARERPEPRDAARQDPADRRGRAAGRRPYAIPDGQPVRRRRGGARPRSGRAGCATRGGCGSTGRPATCGSVTSGRRPGRRST